MACPIRRERKPIPDARPGHKPAHTRTVIASTLTRDALPAGPPQGVDYVGSGRSDPSAFSEDRYAACG